MCDVREKVKEWQERENVFECKALHVKMTLKQCHNFQESCRTYVTIYKYSGKKYKRLVNPRLVSCSKCPHGNWLGLDVKKREPAYGYERSFIKKSPEEQFKDFYADNLTLLKKLDDNLIR